MGGNFLISVEQVFSSFHLEKVKLFAKLEITGDVYDTTCCKLEMDISVEDMELVDYCFPRHLPSSLYLFLDMLHKMMKYQHKMIRFICQKASLPTFF